MRERNMATSSSLYGWGNWFPLCKWLWQLQDRSHISWYFGSQAASASVRVQILAPPLASYRIWGKFLKFLLPPLWNRCESTTYLIRLFSGLNEVMHGKCLTRSKHSIRIVSIPLWITGTKSGSVVIKLSKTAPAREADSYVTDHMAVGETLSEQLTQCFDGWGHLNGWDHLELGSGLQKSPQSRSQWEVEFYSLWKGEPS